MDLSNDDREKLDEIRKQAASERVVEQSWKRKESKEKGRRKNNVRIIKYVIAFCFLVFVINWSGTDNRSRGVNSRDLSHTKASHNKGALPYHLIFSNTSLAPKDGRRVRIKVKNKNLTKGECVSLIEEHKGEAGSEGQVSIQKPSLKWKGKMLPWCVDNMDGKGVSFNDWAR